MTFPALTTQAWSTHIKPRFMSDMVDHVSGRSTRRSRHATAYYDVELTYNLLRSDDADLEMQAIAGFFTQMMGAATPFWLAPPGLSAVTAQTLGVADGATKSFALQRSYDVYTEQVAGTSGVSSVYFDGVAQTSAAWAVTPGFEPAITFDSAPPAGLVVSADFDVLWLCRFAEDVLDFEEFMAMLFELRTVKCSTVRP
jgi:uncharacterized protein (TIGR02217 family)